MSKLAILLLVALIGSCLLLVNSSHESRRLFAALDAARSDASELEAEFKRLDTERRAQATHLRVERVARERLQMRSATPAVTTYVFDSAGSATAGAVPGGLR